MGVMFIFTMCLSVSTQEVAPPGDTSFINILTCFKSMAASSSIITPLTKEFQMVSSTISTSKTKCNKQLEWFSEEYKRTTCIFTVPISLFKNNVNPYSLTAGLSLHLTAI